MKIADLQARSEATIIGAGPAGSLAAIMLAKRGVDVVLVEKSRFPRHKVCGCCLSSSAVDALQAAGLAGLPRVLGGVPLNTLLLQTASRTIPMPLENSICVSRSSFDQALATEAKRLGVKVVEDTVATIKQINQFDVTIELRVGQEYLEHQAKVTVVADGISGMALRNLPSLEATVQVNSKVGTGGISTDVECGIEPGTIYMHYAKGGYVGMVRLEDGSIDIAAALDPEFLRANHDAGLAVQSILERAGAIIPEDISEIQWRGTAPLTRSRRQVAASRIFVLGDSAAYVEPFTGEGIAWALNSAVLAAPLIERGTRIWSDGLARQWQKTFKNQIRCRQNYTSIIAWLLKQESLAHLGASILHACPPLREPVVKAIAQPGRS